MEDQKDKHNHTGQQPSDVPSEKLTKPPQGKRPKKLNRNSDFNSTAKDPNLGNRNPKGH